MLKFRCHRFNAGLNGSWLEVAKLEKRQPLIGPIFWPGHAGGSEANPRSPQGTQCPRFQRSSVATSQSRSRINDSLKTYQFQCFTNPLVIAVMDDTRCCPPVSKPQFSGPYGDDISSSPAARPSPKRDTSSSILCDAGCRSDSPSKTARQQVQKR